MLNKLKGGQERLKVYGEPFVPKIKIASVNLNR